MNLLSWNCRGLGNHRAERELGDIIQAQVPTIVFLSETWSSRSRMERIKNMLEFDGLFTVPSDGRGGGLALMWKGRDMVWVDNFSKYHIDAIVNGGLESAWRLTGFYGEPDNNHQSEGWDMLRMLSSKPKLPWCCFGDLNELLEVSDKRGGVPRAHSQMQMFRKVLDHCGFMDLGYSGPDFTWHG